MAKKTRPSKKAKAAALQMIREGKHIHLYADFSHFGKPQAIQIPSY